MIEMNRFAHGISQKNTMNFAQIYPFNFGMFFDL